VITHGPMKGHLDRKGAGCIHLNTELERVRPRLTIWDHIHVAMGQEEVCWDAVQRMYDRAMSRPGVGGHSLFGLGVLMWVWKWVLWLLLRKRTEAVTTLLNAAIVGSWGVANGVSVEI